MRLQRLRRTDNLRRMFRETRFSVDNLIMPMIVCPGTGIRHDIPEMPGVSVMSPDNAGRECLEIQESGIPAVYLYGIPAEKDDMATEAIRDNGAVQQAIREIRYKAPEMVIISDICLGAYTSHGQCGILEGFEIDYHKTHDQLGAMAVSHAESGVDIVAPSGMIDGSVDAIRNSLELEDFTDVLIMACAAKFASSLVKPFNPPQETPLDFGDTYLQQVSPSNRREAIRELKMDEYESADILSVMPSLLYLDIIKSLRDITDLPVAAFNSNGEYSMIISAAGMRVFEYENIIMEILTSIKRAGADLIVTWFAKKAAEILKST